jgi:SAM-dependent methyltransferase
MPVDRYYVEQFVSDNARDIRARVLEVGDRFYTEAFGRDGVEHSDVLQSGTGNHEATVVGDLCSGAGIPRDAYDCIILTQVVPSLYDFKAGLANAMRALKPGGVMLVTLAGIAQVRRGDDGAGESGDFWRFTSMSAKRVFAELFPPENLTIRTYGNVLAATAFLHGLAAEELSPGELNYHDPDFEMIIAVRAVRAAETGQTATATATATGDAIAQPVRQDGEAA